MLQEFLKIAFLLVTAPIWFPFAKAVWGELQDLFEEEGGLFGDEPSAAKRAQLEAQRHLRPSPVAHEWIANVRPDAARSDAAGARASTVAQRQRGPSAGAPASARPAASAAARGRQTFR
ncbi:MAG: hypothetical protein R3F49_02230 [Planctomycetota bacterium]